MHTINPLIGRFQCVFQELLWTCKVIEFGRRACHVTYQGPSCNPTLKFTPNIMIYSQCGRKAMRRCCHSTESIANFFIKILSAQSISFLRLKAFCLAQEFRKIAEMTRHDLWLQVYFQLGCHLNHCNVSHCFLQLIFLTKRRTPQWVYEKTIAKSKFIQNTCSGSWFLCKEWNQFTLSEATLGRHLCSTNHVVIVWERG